MPKKQKYDYTTIKNYKEKQKMINKIIPLKDKINNTSFHTSNKNWRKINRMHDSLKYVTQFDTYPEDEFDLDTGKPKKGLKLS